MNQRPFLQFSLTAMLVLTTVVAVMLSAFVGISRLLGISMLELLITGVGQYIYSVPRLIVTSVGLAMAVGRLRTHRRPAMLTAVAMIGFMGAILLVHTMQIAAIASMQAGRISSGSIGWIFGLLGFGYAIVDTACWVLILAAIFADRPADPPPVELPPADPLGSGDPFGAPQ